MEAFCSFPLLCKLSTDCSRMEAWKGWEFSPFHPRPLSNLNLELSWKEESLLFLSFFPFIPFFFRADNWPPFSLLKGEKQEIKLSYVVLDEPNKTVEIRLSWGRWNKQNNLCKTNLIRSKNLKIPNGRRFPPLSPRLFPALSAVDFEIWGLVRFSKHSTVR